MDNVPLKVNKKKSVVKRDELEQLSKEDLLNRVFQLEAHVLQLKNILNKQCETNERTVNRISKKRGRVFDFSKCHQRHVLFKFLYCGWDYQGFAVQENTNKTIEYELFRALEMTCLIQSRQTSNYNRCGRTDKGVSAFCQVISLDVRSKFPPEHRHRVSEEIAYVKMLNRVLPEDIRVICWSPAEANFSARFDCKQRTYRYFFPKGNLNIDAMRAGARLMVGGHDFRNLCKMDVGNGVVLYERTIRRAEISIVDERSQDCGYTMCKLEIVGQAFLWHQIRCIMGVLILIGEGKEEPSVVSELLDIKTNPRKPQYTMASEIPLNLFRCDYDADSVDWVVEEENVSHVVKTLQQLWSLNSIKATMIRQMIDECESLRGDGEEAASTLDQASVLLLGSRSKVYQPLMARQTCEPLEKRIDHYLKRQRLEVVGDPDESDKIS